MIPPEVFVRELSLDEGMRLKQVADNLSTHKTPEIREWATSSVELVFTPTYASFLNRIECHFSGSVSSTPTTPTGPRSPR